MKIVILLKENWSHMDKFSIHFKIFRDANSWGAMRQEMAIFKVGNSVCRVQIFFRSFHFIFSKKWTAGGDASENGDFQREKQRLQGPYFLMIMMMMISCWCCDDDASLSSIAFLKSLIAQQPFCKMILTKLFFCWDRRINVTFATIPSEWHAGQRRT